jgi:radical SAM protein with 4Fe4S-binding SPASM domain
MSVGPHFVRLAAYAEERSVPLSVTMELALACNLRCVHCYNFDRELSRHPDPTRREELSAAEIRRIIDEIRAEGALFLAFTGGEPLSHPKVEDFIGHAAGSGMFVRLKSNGTLITAKRARSLRDAGLRAVDVSVYGASPQLHDPFVRQPGAFGRTIAGVRAAHDAGLEVRLSFVVHSANADEVDAMAALARELAVPCNFDTHVTARHDRSRSSLDLSLDRGALERLFRGPFATLVSPLRERGSSIACPCARSVCGIGSCGDVYPCIGAPLPAGNLKTKSFAEVWRHSPTLQWVRGLRAEDFSACHGCDHARYCRRTSGVMLSNSESFTGPGAFGDDLCCVEAEVVHGIADEGAVVAAIAK